MLGWLIVFGILAALAALFPWELGTKADPLAPTPPGVHPEWYLIFYLPDIKICAGKLLFFSGEAVVILAF